MTGEERDRLLPERVGDAEAADMLQISVRRLRALIADGEIPVIQPPAGRQKRLIEVAALRDYLDRQRALAQREATQRRKRNARLCPQRQAS